MTAKKMKPRPKPAEYGLVGRCFHVWGEDGFVQYQGIVRGQIDAEHYLVQWFDWMAGEPSYMHVVSVKAMGLESLKGQREPGAWQFYEDDEHMNFWFDHRAPKRPSKR